jgi:flagellar protein FlbD
MIQLTRLNGNRLDVNCDLIKYAEASPDTVLTLVTGEKLIVLESCDEVTFLTRAYRANTLREAWPDAPSALSARIAFDAQKFTQDHASVRPR